MADNNQPQSPQLTGQPGRLVWSQRRRREKTKECWFCRHQVNPDYKDVDVLRSFLTPRGKILPKRITGLCAKHQRRLSKTIKHARTLALLR